MTDAELAELYDQYAHVLFHRCMGILHNEEEARDAVQETFARVIRHSDDFKRQSSPLTWMYRISTNYCLNRIRNRKGRAEKRHVHKHDIAGDGIVALSPEASEDHQRIMDLLDKADEQTRKVVIHTFFDDCTREETARLVGISVPTVRKRLNTFLSRARRQFDVAAAVIATLIAAPDLASLWSPS